MELQTVSRGNLQTLLSLYGHIFFLIRKLSIKNRYLSFLHTTSFPETFHLFPPLSLKYRVKKSSGKTGCQTDYILKTNNQPTKQKQIKNKPPKKH